MSLGKYFKDEGENLRKRCICHYGANEGQRYPCGNPCDRFEFFERWTCDCYPDVETCPDGVSMTITSYLTLRRGHDEITSFVFLEDVTPGAPCRVWEGQVSVWKGGKHGRWVDVMPEPFSKGDDLNGVQIQNVVTLAEVSGVCSGSDWEL